VKKERAGYTLSRPQPSIFAETLSLHIPSSAAAEWRTALSRIEKRVRTGQFHLRPATLSLRLVLGCRRGARQVRCFGGMPRRSCHVVGVGDSLFLLVELRGWVAYPISHHELESIVSQMA
jgi:hypothetical protein